MVDIRNTYGRTVVRILNSGIVPDYADPEEEPQFFGAAGTGVLYRPEGPTNLADDDLVFMTNAHVIDSAAVLFVNHPEWGGSSGLRLPATAIGALRVGDKAMIVVRGVRQTIADLKGKQSKYAADLQTWFDHVMALGPLPFPTRDMLPEFVDKECYVVGFPLNQANQVITKGVISSIQLFQVSADKTLLLFQTDAAMNHGNSGGALMVPMGEGDDARIYYAGIPSLGIPDASNIGYVLPYHHVASTMHGFSTHPDSGLQDADNGQFLNVEGPYHGFFASFMPGDTDGYMVSAIDENGCPFDLLERDLITKVGDAEVGDDGLLQLSWTDVRVPFDTAFDELDLADGEVSLTVVRNGTTIKVMGEWEFDANLPVRKLFGGLEPLKFEAFAGLVVSELNVNQIESIPALSVFLPRAARLKPRLAVVMVDPLIQSPVVRGWLVVAVNGSPVNTYEDWQRLFLGSVETNTMAITFNTLQGSTPILSIGDVSEMIHKTVQLSKVRNERLTDGVEEARFIEREKAYAGPSIVPTSPEFTPTARKQM